MYRKCATEISALHQLQVTESLLALMQKMPYADITVTQLCQTAGVTRRVFYHLFNSKTDALHAMIDQTILASAGYRPELRDEALRFFYYWRERSPVLEAIQANQLTDILLERMTACMLREDYDILYWLKVNGWEDEQDVMIFHLCGIMGMTFRWYYRGFPESPEEMAARLKRIVTQPLAQP